MRIGPDLMRVLVTRAEPAASRTRKNLVSAGYEPIVLPIFTLVDLGNLVPELKHDGVIFTSANAVEVLKRRDWKGAKTSGPAYCVGSKTAQAAREIGFEDCVVASGGGAALCKEMAAQELPKTSKFLYPTTPDRSFDMSEHLGVLGFDVDLVELYQTRKVEFQSGAVANTIDECKAGAVLVYSARSAEYLVELLDAEDELPDFSSICLIGISKTATNIMLKYPWRDVYVSDMPDEETMLSLLERITSA